MLSLVRTRIDGRIGAGSAVDRRPDRRRDAAERRQHGQVAPDERLLPVRRRHVGGEPVDRGELGRPVDVQQPDVERQHEPRLGLSLIHI